MGEEDCETPIKKQVECFYFCLLSHEPRPAEQALRDAKAASDLAPEDRNVVALNRDVEKLKKLALRENKRLAKEMTAWVETAQGKFAENGGNEADCAQQ